jgi:two-component system, LytTR family, sensor kinase
MSAVRNLSWRSGWWLGGWLLFWIVLGLIDGVQIYAGLGLEGRSVDWFTALRRGVESHLLWAAVGMGVLWFAERCPFQRGRLGRSFGCHAGGCAVTFAIYSVVYSAWLQGQPSLKDGSIFEFGEALRKMLVLYPFNHAVMYTLIVLGYHAWLYNRSLRERDRFEAELEAKLTRARLDALRMQVNPHFLFNSLNTIAALVHEQPDAADRMITQLSELLRVSLDNTDVQEIPLERELGIVERYLELERARFGDRMRVHLRTQDGVMRALVPSLILQPLVENAVRHGVEARDAGAEITVTARRLDGDLELTVRDNGPGLPQTAPTPPREGIGLSNTRSRLAHLYGPRHRLDLVPADGGGLEVRLRIPYHAPAGGPKEP